MSEKEEIVCNLQKQQANKKKRTGFISNPIPHFDCLYRHYAYLAPCSHTCNMNNSTKVYPCDWYNITLLNWFKINDLVLELCSRTNTIFLMLINSVLGILQTYPVFIIFKQISPRISKFGHRRNSRRLTRYAGYRVETNNLITSR